MLPLLGELSRLVEAAPLAVLAAAALLFAAHQTRRLVVVHEQLYKLALAATARDGHGSTAPDVGQLAQALARVTDGQLQGAVEAQRRQPTERLGSLLVRRGALTRRQLDGLLAQQRLMRCGKQPAITETVALASYARRVLLRRE